MIKTGAEFLFGFAGNQTYSGVNYLKKISILFIVLFVCAGCARVKRIDQLLTLKDLADEQAVMSQYIEEQDQKFELMLNEARTGTLDQYLNKQRILTAFGDPVFVKHVKEDDQELESWLYRYSTEFFDSEKIYLYFDADNNLVKSKHRGKKDGEIR